MKVKIEFEIPNWTRWIAIGLVGGTVLGYGVASVRAKPMSVTTSWRPGELLTAAALNQNFKELQDAINAHQAALDALQVSDCPTGYLRNAAITGFVSCQKGFDEIVKVGTGNAAFWIDRFEASIWSSLTTLDQQYGLESPSEYPMSFPANGQHTLPLYAISATGVRPSAFMTWFQASAACEASGKRLPTLEEWQRAARGTVDPGFSDGKGQACLTHGEATRNAGQGSACRSVWGAEDMVGNLWEWTAEWYAAVQPLSDVWPTSHKWGRPEFNSDIVWGVTSAAGETSNITEGVPSAALRGGGRFDGTDAGLFALSLNNAATSQDVVTGFRCVTPR